MARLMISGAAELERERYGQLRLIGDSDDYAIGIKDVEPWYPPKTIAIFQDRRTGRPYVVDIGS